MQWLDKTGESMPSKVSGSNVASEKYGYMYMYSYIYLCVFRYIIVTYPVQCTVSHTICIYYRVFIKKGL